MKNIIIVIYCILLIFCSQTVQAQPNILFVIADDLGNDAIEGFGIEAMEYPNTPTLNTLRSEGITYMNTWATPQCTPTRASIMSGKYGINTGVMKAPENLDLEHESIFNYIRNETNNAYRSAVIGKWHISQPVNVDHPYEHGVDYYEGIINGTIDDYYNWEKVKDGEYVQVEEYVTTHLTNLAINWISDQEDPWFLWLAHIAPHSPFQVPPDSLHTLENPTSNQEKYRASIEALDSEIGRLISSMNEETKNNTVIVFIGDNGTPNPVLSGYPNQHGKGTMYEGGVRVPMIISGAGVTRNGEQEYGLTQVNDLYATLIDVVTDNDLAGGIYNSYSIEASFQGENAIQRDYVYSDYIDEGTAYWTIRKDNFKLIENENGEQEFYRLDENIDEENNLVGNLSDEEAVIMEELEAEIDAIRSGWSCNDHIQNGEEEAIDDCVDCPEVDVLSDENIGCCDSPDEPSVYYEYEETDQRHVYSNGFPNHDYCYNPNNIPGQSYHYYRMPKEPLISNEIISIIRDNGRPARHFGVALNGVTISPAPGTPFIYTDKNTGEFNWNWVYEPTNNQGDGQDQVKLDCATAHTNGAGYHYHGEMYEHLETDYPGITTATSIPEIYQVGWASDGFPIVYKFGPDKSGEVKELIPSFQLKGGERPGDGIEAPCGPYTGKYTVDYEYIEGLGDLDACNGIEADIALETALGTETFGYYYVVTSSFPQIGRCLMGEVSLDFETSADPVSGVDMDGDGYLSQFECDDTNANINPSAEEIPNNGIDEDCDGTDLLTSTYELADSKINIYPNPVSDILYIEVKGQLRYSLKLFSGDGKLLLNSMNRNYMDIGSLEAGVYLLEIEDLDSNKKIVEKVIVGR